MKTILLILLLFTVTAAADYLSYSGLLRNESDAAIIANLKRKGWQDAPRPSYDPATQAEPAWINGAWQVRNLTAEELAAKQAATDDTTERAAAKAMIDKLKANTATAAEQRRCLIYLLRQLQ